MANEAVIIELLGQRGDPVRYTCSSAATILKGTILELADPRTVTANNGSGDVVAGIAAADKNAADTATNLAAYTNGIFDLTCGGAITCGAFVSTSGANLIKTATEAEIAAGKALGKALETGTATEVIAVKVMNV